MTTQNPRLKETARTPSPSRSHDPTNGILGDNHEYTPHIRRYAKNVVNGNHWPIAVDLTQIIFESRTRAKRRNGVCTPRGEHIIIGVSEHVIDNAGFNPAKHIIRHELIHAWQHQHAEHAPVRLADGTILDHIEPGHNDDAWTYWSKKLQVQRTNTYYRKSLTQYKYAIKCPACGKLKGKHRACKTIRQASLGNCQCTDCNETIWVIRPSEPNVRFEGPDVTHKHFLNRLLKEFVEGANRYAV